MKVAAAILLLALGGCARATDGRDGRDLGGGGAGGLGGSGGTGGNGGDVDMAVGGAGGGGGGGAGGVGGGGGGGGGAQDMAMPADMATSGGIINGGPCASGASGATGIRVRWVNSGGTATVSYEAFGMPDHSGEHVGAYGTGPIGSYTPEYVDTGLAQGGLLLDSGDFVDIDFSASGISSIASATLAIYGRSYDTTTSGSFSWQSATDYGQTDDNLVSNAPPYQWYKGDIGTSTIAAGSAGVKVRIRSGPSSDTLVVNKIEICLVAN